MSHRSFTLRNQFIVQICGKECQIDVIKGLMEIYVDMVELCDGINRNQGFPNMLAIGLVFSHTLFTNFVIVKSLFGEGKLATSTLVSITYLIFYNLLFLVITVLNSLAVREVYLKITIINNKLNYKFSG